MSKAVPKDPRTDWANLDPIPASERPEKPKRLSQSFAARMSVCPRSALLYHRHRGGPRSLPMDRGSAFHEFARRATLELIEQGEARMPADVARTFMQEVMKDKRWTVSAQDADRLRVMAYHWAEHFVIEPEKVVAVETKLTLDLGGFTLSGILDLVVSDDAGLRIVDYKSGFALPSQADFEASFQLPLYAVLLAFGSEDGGLPLGRGTDLFEISEVYPLLSPWEDGLAHRTTWLNRSDLEDHRAYIESILESADHSFETGEWQAVPGSHCSTCAAPLECPIPEHLRDLAGTIKDAEDAEETAVRWLFVKQETDRLWRELKDHAKSEGPIRLGGDLILDFSEVERRTTDYDGLERAIYRTVNYGEPFDLDDYIKRSVSSTFKKRKLGPDE